jgi:RNA polymerase nonessential primary-like sigma factor
MSSAEQLEPPMWDEQEPEPTRLYDVNSQAADEANEAEKDIWDQTPEEAATAATDADLIRVYLNKIGEVPLLDAEDEVELAKRIEAGQFARTIKNVLNPETREATLEKARQTMMGVGKAKTTVRVRSLEEVDQELDQLLELADALPKKKIDQLDWLIADGDRAKERFTDANLRLVVSMAKRYQGHGMDLLDLIQEGNLGLIRAVEKFDYTQGWKFSTYGERWIKQAILRGLSNQSRTIRLPNHVAEEVNKVNKVCRTLKQELGREPTQEEIANESGFSTGKVDELRQFDRPMISLDMQVGEDEDSALGEFVTDEEDDDGTAAERAVEHDSMARALGSALMCLPDREQKIVRMRMGLDDGDPKTFEAIGQKMGVTRERIRQLEMRAMIKLRSLSVVAELADYDT